MNLAIVVFAVALVPCLYYVYLGYPLLRLVLARQLLSHKLLRYLVPLFLFLLLGSNVWLSITTPNPAWDALLILQGVFYGARVLGAVARTSAGRSWVLMIPYYFCLVNAAALLALLSVLRGERAAGWSPRGGFTPNPTWETSGATETSRSESS